MATLYSTKDVPKLIALVASYALLAELRLWSFDGIYIVSFLWLAGGLALVVVFLEGYRYLPAVFLGALIGSWLTGSSFGFSLMIGLRHTAAVFLGIWLLKWEGRFDPSLSALGDYLRILLLALGFGLLTAVSVKMMQSLSPDLADGLTFSRRWQGSAVAIIVITPLLLVWRRLPSDWATPGRAYEAAAIVGLSLFTGQIVFLDWFTDSLGFIARGYWMFPLVAWAAVRLGRHGAVLIVATTALQALVGAHRGTGFFAIDIAKNHLANYYFYMGCLSAVGMSLATYVAGRRQAEREILAIRDELQATLDAIPDRLFELGPDGRIYGYHFHRTDLWALPPRGETLHESLAQDQAEICMSALSEAAQKGWSFGKMICLQLPGGERWYELSASAKPRTEGQGKRYLVLSRDITEHKQAEQRLKEREAQLSELTMFLHRVREEDRRRFARELHDELGQALTALRIDFDRLAHELVTAPRGITSRLAAIDQMIDATVDATRRICDELRPAMLDDLGLEAALASHTRSFAKRFGVACDLALDREDYGLDATLSTAIFRIVQESLTNVARHARASHAMVVLEDRGDYLMLAIADDGCGLPNALAGVRKTHGLTGIRERVRMLGAQMAIDSAPDRGTHIEVSIPKRGVQTV